MNVEIPTVVITEAALRAIRLAEEDDGSEADHVLHLTIDARFQNDLYFGPKEPNDIVVVANGITIAMDARTARRANGLRIDYLEGRGAVGFKLENPNESPVVKGVRPADVLRMLARDDDFELVDARGADERAKARVAVSRLLDERYERELSAMPKKRRLVFMGHHSRGGQSAAQRFYDRGFTNVWYVVGGIDAWSTRDPSIPRY